VNRRPLVAALMPALILVASSSPAQAAAGQPWSWGNPEKGGPVCHPAGCWTSPQPAWSPSVHLTVTTVDAENNFNLAIMPGGTVEAWGQNRYGQLGDGTTQNTKSNPVQVTRLTGVTMTGGGNSDAIALESDGTVWTWGLNNGGQLGDGTSGGYRTVPGHVTLPGPACAVDAGASHDYALLCDGTVWAWGSGAHGDLGQGNTTQHDSPVQIRGLANVTAIASGNLFGLAKDSGGSWYGWGYDAYGQLCNGTTAKAVLTPQPVPSLSGVTEVSAGGNLNTDGHILALLPDGTVEACGANASGQLGDGSTTKARRPARVANLTGITAIAAGGYHSLALDSSGNVWAWGGNDYGQVGNGATTDVLKPVEVLPGAGVISAGSLHSDAAP